MQKNLVEMGDVAGAGAGAVAAQRAQNQEPIDSWTDQFESTYNADEALFMDAEQLQPIASRYPVTIDGKPYLSATVYIKEERLNPLKNWDEKRATEVYTKAYTAVFTQNERPYNEIQKADR